MLPKQNILRQKNQQLAIMAIQAQQLQMIQASLPLPSTFRQYSRKLDTGQQHVVWEKIVDRPSAKSVSPIDGNLASSIAKDQIEADTTARHSSRSIIPMWKHKHTTLDIQSSAASYMYARGKTLRINYSVNLRQTSMIGQVDRVISTTRTTEIEIFRPRSSEG